MVVEHGEPVLTLLAIRDLLPGTYWPFASVREAAARAGVPIVTAWEGLDPDPHTLLQQLDSLTGREGIVLRFDDGHMLKLKTPWYVRIHGVLTSIRLENFAWDVLAQMAVDEGYTTNHLIATFHDEILAHRGEVPNFASFLRVTCMRYLQRKLEAQSGSPPIDSPRWRPAVVAAAGGSA